MASTLDRSSKFSKSWAMAGKIADVPSLILVAPLALPPEGYLKVGTLMLRGFAKLYEYSPKRFDTRCPRLEVNP